MALNPTSAELHEDGRRVVLVRSGAAHRVDVIGRGRGMYMWVGGVQYFDREGQLAVLTVRGEATLRRIRDAITEALRDG